MIFSGRFFDGNGGSGGGPYRTTHATLAVRSAATNHACSVLPIIIKLRSAGTLSLAKIANELQRRGVPTARGGHWHPMTVGRLLARRNLAGCPMTLPEMRAFHRNHIIRHARSMKWLTQRLIHKGFNNTVTLSQELNQINKLTVTGRQWTVNSFGMYLKYHHPNIYDKIARGSGLRSQQIGAAIDRLIRQGVFAHRAIAEALNTEGVPTLSGRATWTVLSVGRFLRESHRTRITAAVNSKMAQIEAAIEQLIQQEVVTRSAIAERLNQSGVPTLSGKGQWRTVSVQAFLKKRGRTRTMASAKASTEQIEAAIDRLNQQGAFALAEIAEALNNDGVPTLSGKARWNKNLVHLFLKKLKRTKTAAQIEAKLEQLRSALNGIVRRHGKMTGVRLARELNKSGVPTLSGEGKWTAQRVYFLYRRMGRQLRGARYWTKTRVARVRELRANWFRFGLASRGNRPACVEPRSGRDRRGTKPDAGSRLTAWRPRACWSLTASGSARWCAGATSRTIGGWRWRIHFCARPSRMSRITRSATVALSEAASPMPTRPPNCPALR
jgi:protein-disulfide isomerase-like protein with CxxC motif